MRNGAIGKNEDGGDGFDVLLNLSSDILLVELVLPDTTSVGQPGRVEDANLGKSLSVSPRSQTRLLTTTPFLLVNS